MIKQFKKLFLDFLKANGYTLSRYWRSPEDHARADMKQEGVWLKNLAPKTILDIGANRGQFARYAKVLFPEAMIYSFEPLPQCYEELTKAMAQAEQFKAFNVALGNEVGVLEMMQSEASASSSALAMADLHKDLFPHTQNCWKQEVQVLPLDHLRTELTLEKPLLVKIDVQGFEDQVILGSQTVLALADIVIVELSMHTLYEGQPLFEEIYQLLFNLGFRFRGSLGQLCSPIDGKPLQMDGVFMRVSSELKKL